MTTRRSFIARTALTSGAALALPAFSFNILKNRPPQDQIVGHGDYRYKVIRDWAKLSLRQNPLLNCHEMVMDRQGRLIMIGDHTTNNVLVFDKSGKLLDYWGTEYPGGHGLTLSKEGDEDNLILVDSGWFLNKDGQWEKQSGVVVKTSLTGKVLFHLGHPRTIGIYKDDEDFNPTEAAVAPNGDIYVADGYGSDYILQYNHRGEYIRHFGGHHNENPLHNLKNAHGVAIDSRNVGDPVLVCTSRNENCFKFFTLDGKFIKSLPMPGLFVCRPVIDDKNLYAGVCWSRTHGDNKGWVQGTGFVTIMEGSRVVSNPGGTAPQYKNGVLQQMYQAETKIFEHGHDVCVDEDKNLYVCQLNAHQSPPIKLERV